MNLVQWLKENKGNCNIVTIYLDDYDNIVADCWVKQATSAYASRTITIGQDINSDLTEDHYKELSRKIATGPLKNIINDDDTDKVKEAKRRKLLGL